MNKDPVIYLSERNLGSNPGHRLHSMSIDGGNTLSIFGSDLNLPDSKVTNWTGIVSGISRFDSDGVSRILFTTPKDKTVRADLAIFVSNDECESWNNGKVFWEGPAGYSDVYQLNSTHFAILFENGENEFAQRISFGLLSAGDLKINNG